MSDIRKAAEMALEVFDGPVLKDATEHAMRLRKACDLLRQALAQPEQEPVAWVYNGILHEFDPSEFATSKVTPLYTAPPKREWVGLTDEEVEAWRGNYDFFDSALVREVEAKLKEKNGG